MLLVGPPHAATRHPCAPPLQQACDERQALYDSDLHWTQHETPEGYLVRICCGAWCLDLLSELAADRGSVPCISSLITSAQGVTCCISFVTSVLPQAWLLLRRFAWTGKGTCARPSLIPGEAAPVILWRNCGLIRAHTTTKSVPLHAHHVLSTQDVQFTKAASPAQLPLPEWCIQALWSCWHLPLPLHRLYMSYASDTQRNRRLPLHRLAETLRTASLPATQSSRCLALHSLACTTSR